METQMKEQVAMYTDEGANPHREGPQWMCVVVERAQMLLYHKRWPHLVYLTLPQAGLGISYSRFVVKRICQGATTERGEKVHIPRFWMLDDNITFIKSPGEHWPKREECIEAGYTGEGGYIRMKEDTRMIISPYCAGKALREIENDPRCAEAAVVTIDKGDYNHITKDKDKERWDKGGYKAFLIRSEETAKVDFIPGLTCAEDIDFMHRVRQDGGKILKMMHPFRIECSVMRNKHAIKHTAWIHQLQPWRREHATVGLLDETEVTALQELQLWITKLRLAHKDTGSVESVMYEWHAIEVGFSMANEIHENYTQNCTQHARQERYVHEMVAMVIDRLCQLINAQNVADERTDSLLSLAKSMPSSFIADRLEGWPGSITKMKEGLEIVQNQKLCDKLGNDWKLLVQTLRGEDPPSA